MQKSTFRHASFLCSTQTLLCKCCLDSIALSLTGELVFTVKAGAHAGVPVQRHRSICLVTIAAACSFSYRQPFAAGIIASIHIFCCCCGYQPSLHVCRKEICSCRRQPPHGASLCSTQIPCHPRCSFEVHVRLTDGVITLVLFAHREKTYLCRRQPRYGAPLCSTQASSWIISWASAGCQALLCCAGCSALLRWACNLLMMPWSASSVWTSSTTLLPGFLRAHRSASLLFCFMPNLEEKEVMTTISARIHQRLWAMLC